MMNQQKMMKQMQQLQAKMAKAQEELGLATVEGSAGGGAVKIVMTGHQKVQSVTIEPEAAEDVEILQDLILSAINDAQDKANDMIQKKMAPLTGGLGGLF